MSRISLIPSVCFDRSDETFTELDRESKGDTVCLMLNESKRRLNAGEAFGELSESEENEDVSGGLSAVLGLICSKLAAFWNSALLDDPGEFCNKPSVSLSLLKENAGNVCCSGDIIFCLSRGDIANGGDVGETCLGEITDGMGESRLGDRDGERDGECILPVKEPVESFLPLGSTWEDRCLFRRST